MSHYEQYSVRILYIPLMIVYIFGTPTAQLATVPKHQLTLNNERYALLNQTKAKMLLFISKEVGSFWEICDIICFIHKNHRLADQREIGKASFSDT